MSSYTWTTPDISYTNGQVLGAGDVNTINNNIGYLYETGNVAGRMTQTVQQSITTTGYIQLTNMASTYLYGGVTFGSNALTVPVAGLYLINYRIEFLTTPAQGYLEANVYVGSGRVCAVLQNITAATTYFTLSGSDVIQIAANSAVSLYAGTDVTTNVTRVAAPEQVSALSVTLMSQL